MKVVFDENHHMMYEVTCRICEKKFPAPQKNYVFCSPECRAEGRRIIWRWSKKLKKRRLFKEMCEK